MILYPNLPEKKVSVVAVSGKYQNIISALKALKIKCIEIPMCDMLALPVGQHADMVLNHLGGEEILLYNYSKTLNEALLKEGFKLNFCKNNPKAKYPYDIGLNSLSLGDLFVTLKEHCDKTLLEYNKEKTLVNVKQGYVKCSVCVVNEKNLIVSDEGIYNALKGYDINCLLVSKEDILLEGYNCGFIGGCAGLIDKNTLAFTGKVKTHRDGEKIYDFVKSAGVNIIELTDAPLIDIGGIIPLR